MVSAFGLLGGALLCSFCGASWFALAKPTHWAQVRGKQPPGSARPGILHTLGALALGGSLGLCLAADHATMAGLVWVMLFSASALLVAFTLAWRPHWLRWLVPWAR